MRWEQDTYKGYKSPTRGIRKLHDTYKGYKVGTKHLEGVRCMYEIPTRYEKGMGHLQGHEVGTRHLQGAQVPYKCIRQVHDTYKG